MVGCQPNHLSLSRNTFVKPYFVSFTSDSTIFSIHRPILLENFVRRSYASCIYYNQSRAKPMLLSLWPTQWGPLTFWGWGCMGAYRPLQIRNKKKFDLSWPYVKITNCYKAFQCDAACCLIYYSYVTHMGSNLKITTCTTHLWQEKSKNSFVRFQ